MFSKLRILSEYVLIRYKVNKARLGECLLNYKALLRDSACILEALPGKLDIKRPEPGILIIN